MKPRRKVTAGALAGSLSTLTVWVLARFYQIDVPATEAIALTTVFTFVASWVVSENGGNGSPGGTNGADM